MTEFVVNMTPAEFGASQKRKAIKARNATITSAIALLGMCTGIWYALNQMVNH